jgi:hypothetical protein
MFLGRLYRGRQAHHLERRSKLVVRLLLLTGGKVYAGTGGAGAKRQPTFGVMQRHAPHELIATLNAGDRAITHAHSALRTTIGPGARNGGSILTIRNFHNKSRATIGAAILDLHGGLPIGTRGESLHYSVNAQNGRYATGKRNFFPKKFCVL